MISRSPNWKLYGNFEELICVCISRVDHYTAIKSTSLENAVDRLSAKFRNGWFRITIIWEIASIYHVNNNRCINIIMYRYLLYDIKYCFLSEITQRLRNTVRLPILVNTIWRFYDQNHELIIIIYRDVGTVDFLPLWISNIYLPLAIIP